MWDVSRLLAEPVEVFGLRLDSTHSGDLKGVRLSLGGESPRKTAPRLLIVEGRRAPSFEGLFSFASARVGLVRHD